MVQLFSTKLLSPAQLQAFVCAGFALEMSDFIKVVPATALTSVPQADYFLLTSQNALYALRSMPCYEQLPHRKAFCVGEKTRKLLEAEGWEVVASFDYAKQLAPYLVKHYAKSSFVFFLWRKTNGHLTYYFESKSYTTPRVSYLPYTTNSNEAHQALRGAPLL